MGYLYFPEAENLRKLLPKEVYEIEIGCANLKGVLPWGFEDPGEFYFFEDKGMNLDNGIMGMTKMFDDKIFLSPTVVEGLLWKNKDGIPNNEMVMGTVIHELTHRRQMKWLSGIAWAIFNIPFLEVLTIEKWARQNEQAATDTLTKIYDKLYHSEL